MAPQRGPLQLSPHRPPRHWLEQHSASFVQSTPRSLHAIAIVRHVEGAPVHEPAQQSAEVVHVAPSATHADVQTIPPPPLTAHVPAQQSAATVHLHRRRPVLLGHV